MKNIPLSDLLDVAICAADAAGKHALENKARRTEATESFTHDVKLVLDLECQRIAEGIIAQEYPDHGILGEEDIRQNSAEGYEWIIDPIDGTMNYTHGFPYWCCSVAVRFHDKVLAGCVFAPDFNDYYTAHIEDPAKLNGEPIQVSETRHLQDAMVFTGLSKHMESASEPHFEMFRMLALNTQKVRINGAAALDICNVAAGHGDGFFETSIYLWDYAAAGLIAEQAGAAMTLYPHKEIPHGATVMVANGNLIEGLRAIHTKCI
ncbi:Fructose-1,6-bisphosphatase/inositol-1-monophosphatase [Pontiella desulfatans]|uniref:Fructose-1,6-bisphosphatase/inositol-1-monophosph atase n=1 Tax=Pontiella desulfatans TaxID=2750659 RepID=A0A6C2U9C3_PONDE|nr:inositol monophosphatase family protein [Pontiella desulfatans]VGO15986.1 Fructose-1,6-bisphosphatase/inositol-1-monophosphatase [Pontiella desulfatans]